MGAESGRPRGVRIAGGKFALVMPGMETAVSLSAPINTPPRTCSSWASFDARSLSARSTSSTRQATSPFKRSSDNSAVRSMT